MQRQFLDSMRNRVAAQLVADIIGWFFLVQNVFPIALAIVTCVIIYLQVATITRYEKFYRTQYEIKYKRSAGKPPYRFVLWGFIPTSIILYGFFVLFAMRDPSSATVFFAIIVVGGLMPDVWLVLNPYEVPK